MVMRIQSCEVLWDTELITCEGVQVVWNGSERSNCVVTSSVCVSSVMVSSLVMSLIMGRYACSWWSCCPTQTSNLA